MIAISVEPSGPRLVPFDVLVFAVLVAVEFNDYFRRGTEEIGHVRADWLLAAKANAVELFVPKQHPELALGVCRILAQGSGKFVCHMHTPHRFLCAARNEICLPLKGEANILEHFLR